MAWLKWKTVLYIHSFVEHVKTANWNTAAFTAGPAAISGVGSRSARGGGSILYLDIHLCESAAEGLEALINCFQAGCKHSNNVDNNTTVQEAFSAENSSSFNITHHSGHSNIRCGLEEQSARGGGTDGTEGEEALINGFQAGCKHSNVVNASPVLSRSLFLLICPASTLLLDPQTTLKCMCWPTGLDLDLGATCNCHACFNSYWK